MRATTRAALRAPCRVINLDLDRSWKEDAFDVSAYATAYCLLRRHGWPVALLFLDVSEDTSLDLDELRGLAERICPAAVDRPNEDPFDIALTVAICTRSREKGLRMTLQSLTEQTDDDFEVVVVDNSSSGRLVDDVPTRPGLRLRVVHEPLPGLSRARNRALQNIATPYVAWIDDDEIADHTWIRRVKDGFASPGRPGVVAGLMLPAELDTQAQVDFERYGGFNKGRGLQVQRLSKSSGLVANPLYPLPNFGAGGNMAFRTELLRTIGGFDPRLGAGTLTHGGEETLALSQCLEAGETVLHWPASITWHYHRRTQDELVRQFYGYSAGLSAFYMSVLFASPTYWLRVAALVPRGLADLVVRSRLEERSENALAADFPQVLLQASRRGILAGAWLYLRERARQRRDN